MLDIHSHILFGVDDGAKDLEESKTLLLTAAREGISEIIATPHLDPTYQTSREVILDRVTQLQALATEHNLPIQIFPGQEVRLYDQLVTDLKAGKLVTLKDKHEFLLVEFPQSHAPGYADHIFYDMQLLGVTPILVHPERNNDLIKKPELAKHYQNNGVLMQVTAGSFLGKFGKASKKSAMALLSNDLVDFIASDAHHLGVRDFHMKDARRALYRKFGEQAVNDVFSAAKKIIG